MKIKEDKKIFVQGKDLTFIYMNNIVLPTTVLLKMQKDKIICNSKLEEEFIEFPRIDEVFYFDNADYIVDYNEYTTKSKIELEQKRKEIDRELIGIKKELKLLGYNDLDLYYEFKKQDYKRKQINELLLQDIKTKKLSIKK